MIITWIIGNGFDLNLGLNTGYRYFIDNVYLSGHADEYSDEKKKLISAMDALAEGDRWSDLERMSGQVTEKYSLEEKQQYLLGFQEMLEELYAHLFSEQKRFENNQLGLIDIEEFWKSITHLPERLCAIGAETIGNYRERNEKIGYKFITLNYTNTFDRLLEESKQSHANFDTRFSKADVAHDVQHLHGTLSNTGGIVFCVSSPEQIYNQDFAKDPNFLELWIKKSRNTFYGNHRVQEAKKTINQSSVIVIYGCSYGETDEYLWHMIGTWLMGSETRRLLVLDYDTPPTGSLDLLKTQDARESVKRRLFNSFDIPQDQKEALYKRMWIENSGVVFRNLASRNQ